jgi:hypothetical protein
MKTVKIIIERSADMYSSYADNVEGIYGGGTTPQEAKQSVLEAIRILKENNTADNIPKILLGEYAISYHYDVESLFQYYKDIFSNPAIEKLTGINQKLAHQYSKGLKKPRAEQRKKIEDALHTLGKELLEIEL